MSRANRSRSRRPGWAEYIESFHSQRPGITEAVLERCTDASFGSPYEWLVAGIDAEASVLDLACGSGPTGALVPGRWIGVDRSREELQSAHDAGRVGLTRGDVGRLPIRSDSIDVVLCSMALMLIEPLEEALDEIRRVLTPNGQLRALVATRSPLTMIDRIRYARLFTAARATPSFPPTPLQRHASRLLTAAGLRLGSDQSRRFSYRAGDSAALQLLVDSWYLPGRPTMGRNAALRGPAFASIGIPLRRIIAGPL